MANQRSREQSSHKIPSKGKLDSAYLHVGSALRVAREQLGWSQEKFAEKALVSDGTVGNAENGQHLHAATHRKLVDAINKARAALNPPIEALDLPYPSANAGASPIPPPAELAAPTGGLGLEWPDARNWPQQLLATVPILAEEKSPPANPDEFYRGAAITTAQLNDDCDIRRWFSHNGTQIDYLTLLNGHVGDALMLAKARKENRLILLSGYAGSGKSTALQRMAHDLARGQERFCGLLALEAYQLNPKDLIGDLQLACDHSQADVVALFFDEAGKNAGAFKAALKEIHRRNLPVCFFVAEQPNKCDLLPPTKLRFDLGKLCDSEIQLLLQKLEKKECLGTLADLSPEDRVKFFRSFAQKELLVALREATNGGQTFDDIIQAEFKNIPQEFGRELYRMVALMDTFELPFPVEAARRIIGMENWNKARISCQDIVLKENRTSDLDRVLRARHPVVAQIIFDKEIKGIGSADDAEAFAGDAAKILFGLNELRTQFNKRSIERVAHQFLHHPTFIKSLQGAGTLGDLSRSICLFDELAGGKPNMLVPRLAEKWRANGYPAPSYLLLKEVVSKVGWPTCRSLPGCCDALAFRTCQEYPVEVFEIRDLLNEVKSSLDGRISHAFIILGLVKLHECGGTPQGIDKAITELENAITTASNPPIERLDLLLTHLSKLLEERFFERGDPQDLKRAAKIIEDFIFSDRAHDVSGTLIRRYALVATSPEYHEHFGDLDSAIRTVEKGFAALKDTEGNFYHAAVVLSELLERRFLVKQEAEDIKRSSEIIESHMRDRRVLANRGDLIARYAQLAQVPEYREHLGDLDTAIQTVDTEIVALKGQNQVNQHVAVVAFSQLLKQRYLEKGQQGDLQYALKCLDESHQAEMVVSQIKALQALVKSCPEKIL